MEEEGAATWTSKSNTVHGEVEDKKLKLVYNYVEGFQVFICVVHNRTL